MITPCEILEQINLLTSVLIEQSYCAKQEFSSINNHSNGKTTISWANKTTISETFDSNLSYQEIYDVCQKQKFFNIVLVDGAIVQFFFEFQHNVLLKHRMAFLPSPYLEEFQNEPEIYRDDLMYSEVINRRIVPSPIRFDYDKIAFEEIKHPQSHLTIGQYQNCRIPVKSALTPFQFINFVLNNFYSKALLDTDIFKKCNEIYFGDSITRSESSLVHISFVV